MEYELEDSQNAAEASVLHNLLKNLRTAVREERASAAADLKAVVGERDAALGMLKVAKEEMNRLRKEMRRY